MTLKLSIQVLRGYLKLTCENEPHILPNTKVSAAKDHGKSCMKAIFLRDRLLCKENVRKSPHEPGNTFPTYCSSLSLPYQLCI